MSVLGAEDSSNMSRSGRSLEANRPAALQDVPEIAGDSFAEILARLEKHLNNMDKHFDAGFHEFL